MAVEVAYGSRAVVVRYLRRARTVATGGPSALFIAQLEGSTISQCLSTRGVLILPNGQQSEGTSASTILHRQGYRMAPPWLKV